MTTDYALFDLTESDVPKIIPDEISRFFAGIGFPPLAIDNPQVVGPILQFDILNRGPLPLFVMAGVRFQTSEGEIWNTKGPEHTGPFGRDEWQIGIPEGASSASIRVSLFPFEIALAEQEIML